MLANLRQRRQNSRQNRCGILASKGSQIRLLEVQRSQLTITAPFAGIVVDLDRDLVPGTWAQPQALLGRVKGDWRSRILADVHGGAVGVVMEAAGIRTRHGWFNLKFESEGPLPTRLVRGIVGIDADPASPVFLLWRQVGRILVREQGF